MVSADTKVGPQGSLEGCRQCWNNPHHAWNQQQQIWIFNPKLDLVGGWGFNQPHLAKICNKVKLDRIISPRNLWGENSKNDDETTN